MHLTKHAHGKSRVRVARVWREGAVHHAVEWQCEVLLESDMAPAYLRGDNSDMTATDTVKNTVYYVAKQQRQRCTAEQFGVALAEHFLAEHPKARAGSIAARGQVSAADVTIEQKPWARTTVAGQPHDHGTHTPVLPAHRCGFTTTAPGTRMAYVLARRGKPTTVSAGLENLSVLKTTQSGYEGFGRGPLTSLPETRERMLATTLSATWVYAKAPSDYDAAYDAVMHGLCDTFFGPARGGVYSPGVQATLYAMGCAVLARVGAVSSISLALPNLHFLPTLPANIPFENDVYVATSEPHGSIMATVSRDRDSKFVARPRL